MLETYQNTDPVSRYYTSNQYYSAVHSVSALWNTPQAMCQRYAYSLLQSTVPTRVRNVALYQREPNRRFIAFEKSGGQASRACPPFTTRSSMTGF